MKAKNKPQQIQPMQASIENIRIPSHAQSIAKINELIETVNKLAGIIYANGISAHCCKNCGSFYTQTTVIGHLSCGANAANSNGVYFSMYPNEGVFFCWRCLIACIEYNMICELPHMEPTLIYWVRRYSKTRNIPFSAETQVYLSDLNEKVSMMSGSDIIFE